MQINNKDPHSSQYNIAILMATKLHMFVVQKPLRSHPIT